VKCVYDFDIFIKKYAQDLSLRLLSSTSASNDAEWLMISKLKREFGVNTMKNISTMFQDFTTSKTMMEEFKNEKHLGTPGGISMDVRVLTSGCLSILDTYKCELPEELSSCATHFEEFYGRKHPRRKLTWAVGLGKCEIGTMFSGKPYTIIVTAY
jgi:hypothetical protein